MKLSFMSILALVIGAQVGSGIFMLPTQLAPYGMYAIYGWLISGAGALSLALLFSKLVNKFPDSGGPPIYIQRSLGNCCGFIAAWTYWVVSWFSTLPVIMTIAINVAHVFHLNNILVLEVFFLTFFTIINCYDIRAIARAEVFLTSIKVVPLLVVPILLLLYGSNYIPDYQSINMRPIDAIQFASTITVWGFIGLELATAPASEVQNKTDIPKAMSLGVSIVLFIYIINTYSIFYSVPSESLVNTAVPYAVAMNKCFGGSWNSVISSIIALVCMGTLNSWILATGQMSYGAAKKKLFSSIFAAKNKYGVPIYGILVQYLLLLVFLLFMTSKSINDQISSLIDISVLAYVMIFVASIFVFIKEGIYKTTNILIPIVASAFCAWIFYGVDYQSLLLSFIIPISGSIIYLANNYKTKCRK